MKRYVSKKFLSLFMVLCMICTLLPMNNIMAQADEFGLEDSGEGSDEAKAASGAAIAMTTSEGGEPYAIWVGGTQVTSANAGDEGTAVNSEAATLSVAPISIDGIDYYTDLEAAFDAVREGQTITLHDDITHTAYITIANNSSFTLDLNGFTIYKGQTSIKYAGTGCLTIQDTSLEGGGMITGACNGVYAGLIYIQNGSLHLKSGTVETTIGSAIYSDPSGGIKVSGGTVIGKANGIYTYTSSNLTITGGTIRTKWEGSGTSYNAAIFHQSNGDLNISGGVVDGGKANAIRHTSGKLIISDNASVTSDGTSNATIYLSITSANPVSEITGGIVENTGTDNAIEIRNSNISISGGIVRANNIAVNVAANSFSNTGKIRIPSGSPIIQGGSSAMDRVPEIYNNVQITANTESADETGATVITNSQLNSNILQYKYLKFEPVSSKPTTGVPTVAKMAPTQKEVSFTLTTAPVGTYKVYADNTTNTTHPSITALLNNKTLTLTDNGNDIPAGTYYISVTESGKLESARLALTVIDYVSPVETLTGNVTISGLLKYGETLTAEYIPGNNTGTLSYQWKRGGIDGVDIGENVNTYTLVKDDIGQAITCVVTSDEQTDFVSGSTTDTISKADGLPVSGVEAVACTTAENNNGQLTGLTYAMEFKREDVAGDYIPVSGVPESEIIITGSIITITGLACDDYLVRYAETDTHLAGSVSQVRIGAFDSGSIPNPVPTTPTIPTTPNPIPTPTPAPKVNVNVTKEDVQVKVELTPDVIEYYDGQITLPITSEEIWNELMKEETSAVRVELNLPEQGDDKERPDLNLILESDVLQKAKDNKKDIVVEVNDSNDKVLYSWTFDKTELSNSYKDINDVNLTLKVEKAADDAPFIAEQKSDTDIVPLVLDFAHEGILPSQASVRIYVGNQDGITPGTKVYLYHFNESLGMLETIPYGYQTIVDEDGYITINILHCSDYVVYTQEADSKLYVSLKKQIKVTPTKITLSTADGKNKGKISVKLPVTLEWVKSLDMPTSQSAIGGVTVKFTSGDKKIATVDSQGNITAKAPGEVVIKTTITLYSKKTKTVETRVIVKK